MIHLLVNENLITKYSYITSITFSQLIINFSMTAEINLIKDSSNRHLKGVIIIGKLNMIIFFRHLIISNFSIVNEHFIITGKDVTLTSTNSFSKERILIKVNLKSITDRSYIIGFILSENNNWIGNVCFRLIIINLSIIHYGHGVFIRKLKLIRGNHNASKEVKIKFTDINASLIRLDKNIDSVTV